MWAKGLAASRQPRSKPHKLKHSNTWSSVGGTAGELIGPLGNGVLLEEVHHEGSGFENGNLTPLLVHSLLSAGS